MLRLTRKTESLVRVFPTFSMSSVYLSRLPVCLFVSPRSLGFVSYESINREVKTRPIYECRCDERLNTTAEESTCLGYTGLIGELEHLKTSTR